MQNKICTLCEENIFTPQITEATHIFTNFNGAQFYICLTHYYKLAERNYAGASIEALVSE